MATAATPRLSRPGLVRMLPGAGVIFGIAALLRVVYDPWYLNYDARYALLWARDAWHGFLPDFEADFAPTPHPLSTLVSSLGLPFGEHGGDAVVVWIVLLSFGALVWLTFRLGSVLFSRWVGAAAAVAVLTRPVLDRDVLLAYQDVPFAALIVGAVLLEARQRRRGLPVLVLLGLAGLLRPEAWMLAGLYVLWMWPAARSDDGPAGTGSRGRSEPGSRGTVDRRWLGLAAFAAIAPLVWVLVDWIVTGDPLHSLHGTAALAEEVDRRRHVDQVPYWSLKYFGFTLREPLVLAIPVGLVFAWRWRRAQALLPVAVIAAMTAVFAVGPLFGLPLIARYIRTPAVLLTLFFGLALFGWMLLERGERERRVWIALALVCGGVFLAFLPQNVTMLDGLRLRSEREGGFYRDLRAAGESSRVQAAFERCPRLTASDHRPIPYIRWWLGGDPGTVGTTENGASPVGRLVLVPRRTFLARRFYKENFPLYTPPASYERVYENRTWRIFAAPGCT